MTRFTLPRRMALTTALLVLTAFITGCVGTRLGVSWASVSLVGEQENILLAFNNFVVQIDPRDGSPVQLLDEAGNIRVVPETGEPRTWNLQAEGSPQQFYSAPLPVRDGKLWFANYDRRLTEVDLLAARIDNPAGIPLADRAVADPIIDEDTLYIGYAAGDLQALDLDSPSVVLWTFETESGIWAEPLLLDGVLYFGAMDHNLYAVDARTGEELWRVDLGGAVGGTPALDDGSLYIGSFDRRVFKVSLDGEILAERTVDDWIWGAPVVRDGTVYAADMGGNVYALTRQTSLRSPALRA